MEYRYTVRRKSSPGLEVSILGPVGPVGSLGPGRRKIQISQATQAQTWLTGKNAYCPNFHTEWSSSRLQDLAIQTLLPLGLPNCTANNFH